jgi:hypothetical protein
MKSLLILLTIVCGQSVFAEDGVKNRYFQITGLDQKDRLVAQDPMRGMDYSVVIDCSEPEIRITEVRDKKRTLTFGMANILNYELRMTCKEFINAVMANVDLETYTLEYQVMNNRISKIYTTPKQMK